MYVLGIATDKVLFFNGKVLIVSLRHKNYVVGIHQKCLQLPQNTLWALLEAPQGASNEYPQYMFLGRNRKILCGYPPQSF